MKHKAPALRPKLRHLRMPLPITIPVHRSIDIDQAMDHLFQGMQLSFRLSEKTMAIQIVGYYLNDQRVIGSVPQGMIPYIEEVLPNEEDICVQLECGTCERLRDTMWITIEALPELSELGLAL